MKQHEAIHWVKQGRGYGITSVPVIDIVLVGSRWHIVKNFEPAQRVCGARGDTRKVITEVDPKVVRIDGHAVCGRCIPLLGEIPMPTPDERTVA